MEFLFSANGQIERNAFLVLPCRCTVYIALSRAAKMWFKARIGNFTPIETLLYWDIEDAQKEPIQNNFTLAASSLIYVGIV